MSKTLTISNIKELCKEEIAKSSARAKSQEGISMYDSFVYHSQDEDEIDRTIEALCSSIASAYPEIISSMTMTSGSLSVAIGVSDQGFSDAEAKGDIARVISTGVASDWMARRGNEAEAKTFSEERELALQRLSHILYKRAKVTR